MKNVKVLSDSENITVISEFEYQSTKEGSYQSEANLEQEFIKILQGQSYEKIEITSEEELIKNLRKQLQLLNNYEFTDNEWEYFWNKIIKNDGGIIKKTRLLQNDNVQTIILDNGTKKNIKLIDKEEIFNNKLQVINQYENESPTRKNRYDVTILVNGFPMVQVELKRRGINIREAYNQIERYQRDSFWAKSGLYEYIQIFVISNGTYTKYYSNTTRKLHTDPYINKATVNTFEFTSYWADQKNNAITDLTDFAKTFFAKRTLLNIITKYCVLTTDDVLMVMRPYQITATEKIINKVKMAHNNKLYGSIEAGGYVWHTTGSGKTLTSFKTATLLSENKDVQIEKVLFVVDRKDLDYQTMKEYDNFQEGAANSNTTTKILESQLSDSNIKIIITTIQKLNKLIKKYPEHEIFNKEVVFIFDECHRSQFGDMHKAITEKFKKYYIFGFTGTPIFVENTPNKSNIFAMTTEQIFGEKLHTYTIVNAIADQNVLPFKYEFIKNIHRKENIKDEKVTDIDKEKALTDDKRIKEITKYIIEHYAIKTKTTNSYVYKTINNIQEVAKNNKTKIEKSQKNVKGFNSIFAVASIKLAKKYYKEFAETKKQGKHSLKVALIYSYAANDEVEDDGLQEENPETTNELSKSDRDFLENAIKDYNKMFKTNYDTTSEKFQNYYRDISLRMKNKEIDILIVVNMFLTGFDAKTLNTIWVDKNLKFHGLIQAFSRTNRILNSVKVYGNVVCFRNLENELNEALKKFGNGKQTSIVKIRTYKEYYKGYDENGKHYDGYQEIVEKLKEKFEAGKLIQSEKQQKEFISIFGELLKAMNILSSFDKFEEEKLLTDRQMQDYQSLYVDLYQKFKKQRQTQAVDITDDIEFQMELVKQIEVNVDYIIELIKTLHDKNVSVREIVIEANRAIDSSPDLRNKKDLIDQFINSLDENVDVYDEFEKFMNKKKKEELDNIIKEENLKQEETYKFIEKSFANKKVETDGTDIAQLLPPMSRFTKNNARKQKKEKVIEDLSNFFDKFFSITGTKID